MTKKGLAKLTLLTLTALAVIGVIAACAPPALPLETPAAGASQGATGMPALEGPTWQLETYVSADAQPQTPSPKHPATISFEAGKFGANTGCNDVSGAYALDGEKLSFQPGPMSKRACTESLATQESDFLYGLQNAASYKIEAGKLTLLDADGKVLLTFTEQLPAQLSDGPWQLISFNNGNGMESNQTTAKIVVTFGADGKVSGNAGCNNFNGAYEVDGDKITVGPLAATEMACAEPEGVMDTENAFLQALNNAATFTITGDALTIFDKDGSKLLVFTLAKPVTLSSTPWRLQSFNNGKGGMESNLATEKITAIFGEDGKVAGNAGCNNYSGSYKVDGENITIGPLAATRKMCAEPEGVMETESAFLDNMSNAATFSIENESLTLFDQAGKKLLIFKAAP